MRRPTEKLPARLRMSSETCGCLMPSALPASACVIPRCLMMRYSWIVSSAFVSSCLGLGRPRSANTLPLLSVTLLGTSFGLVLVMLILPFSAVALRIGQPLPDKIELPLRGGQALLGFLLESVQDIDRALQAHGVAGTPCIAAMVGHDLQHAPPSKAPERLRRRIGLTFLSGIEGMTDFRPDPRREGPHVLVGRPDPPDRLEQVAFHHTSICFLVYMSRASRLVESKVPGRKVIIVFSNGPDNASMVAPDDVRAVAEDEGIPLYVISTAEVNKDPISSNVFKRISQRTGGKAYFAKTWQKQVEAFEDIREDLGNSYTVTYYPKANPNEGFRKITIDPTNDPGKKWRIRSRPGYRPSRVL